MGIVPITLVKVLAVATIEYLCAMSNEYHTLIQQELARLPGIVPKSAFGHKGWGVGSSLFAFIDEDTLTIKSLRFQDGSSLPEPLTLFNPMGAGKSTWVRIPITDNLQYIKKYWDMIEESYTLALERDKAKKAKGPPRGKR